MKPKSIIAVPSLDLLQTLKCFGPREFVLNNIEPDMCMLDDTVL